ncbi:hypothetical protein LEMLEM_LOCUS7146 [Lemmus lemmus]
MQRPTTKHCTDLEKSPGRREREAIQARGPRTPWKNMQSQLTWAHRD